VSSYEEPALDGRHLEHKIRNLCGLFVFVDGMRVYLIHQTAKEFLVAKDLSIKAGYDWKHLFEETSSGVTMAKACIHYLLFTDFDDTYATGEVKACYEAYDEDPESDEDPEYDFMDHAAQNRVSHFQNAKVDEDDPLLDSSMTLCDPETRRARIWFVIFSVGDGIWMRSADQPQKFLSLHVAALIVHFAAVRRLLEKGRENVNSEDHKGWTPLHWATFYGGEMSVELLLKNGEIDLNSKSKTNHRALHPVVETGDESVVELLLNISNINVNARYASGKTLYNVQLKLVIGP
jgi:ankyrin repeat protein